MANQRSITCVVCEKPLSGGLDTFGRCGEELCETCHFEILEGDILVEDNVKKPAHGSILRANGTYLVVDEFIYAPSTYDPDQGRSYTPSPPWGVDSYLHERRHDEPA